MPFKYYISNLNDDFDLEEYDKETEVHYYHERMKNMHIIIRRRQFGTGGNDRYEAYINQHAHIFGLGDTHEDAIENLWTRLVLEDIDIRQGEFNELSVKYG